MEAILGGVWTSTSLYDGRPALKLAVDHGVLDDGGRLVGGFGFIYETTPGDNYAKRWLGYIQATRNGQHYGASQHATRYSSLAEARSACERQLYDQRRRYLRKYAGREVVA